MAGTSGQVYRAPRASSILFAPQGDALGHFDSAHIICSTTVSNKAQVQNGFVRSSTILFHHKKVNYWVRRTGAVLDAERYVGESCKWKQTKTEAKLSSLKFGDGVRSKLSQISRNTYAPRKHSGGTQLHRGGWT
eukprot:TRINITY_DN4712_c0_g1_i4.p1 TRINITY_DN4712_c0_g1~~TRINITY_DN4712_c0_g1_i4.p1  ORF type:complete len:134 (-),score=12.99 TRINITY_DN4712_c0_g1_i4:46-447(-)